MAKFTKLQILNITTGIMHTKIDDIYNFFDTVVENGVMTHMLPNCSKAIRPILQRKYSEFSFEPTWFKDISDGNVEYDIKLTEEEKKEFWHNYRQLPSLI